MTVSSSINLVAIRSEFTANTQVAGNEVRPETLGLTNGGFVTAYVSDGQTLVDFYDASGVVQGTFRTAFDGATNNQGGVEIAQLSDGRVLVVWDEDDAASTGLRYRAFSAAGDSLGGEGRLTENVASFALPSIAATTDGGLKISYSQDGGVFTASYSSAIVFTDGPTQVNAVTDGDQTDSSIAVLNGPNGGYVVTYTDTGPADQTIRAVVYNADNTVRTADFVLAAGGDNTKSSTIALQNGGFATVYTDSGWVEGGLLGNGITLQLSDASGGDAGFIHVNATSSVDEVDPAVTQLENGYLLVTWTRPFESDQSDTDIRGRVFTQSGVPVAINGSTDEFSIAGSSVAEAHSSVAHLLGGAFTVAYDQVDADELDLEIRQQVLELVRTSTGDGADDTISGDALRDSIDGAGGADSILGGYGNDTLIGGVGNDTVDGGVNDDIVNGDAGNDRLLGDDGFDTIHGGADADTIEGGFDTDDLFGDGGDDLIYAATQVVPDGSTKGDLLDGGEGADTLVGSRGYDTLIGGVGADSMDGGDGVDIASYAGSATGVSVDLEFGTASGGAAGDTFVSIENLTGSDQNDTLLGSSGNNVIEGGLGADILFSYGGTDTLSGGGGADTIQARDLGGGDILDGGAGAADSLFAFGQNDYDFRTSTVENLERFQFAIASDSAVARFNAAQFRFTTVGADPHAGKTASFVIDMNGEATLDLSGVTFNNFGEPGDSVTIGGAFNGVRVTGSMISDSITGSGSADTLLGGGGIDTLAGGLGADSLSGGEGNDVVVYASRAQRTGDTIDGGAGTADRIRFGPAGNELLVLDGSVTNVEIVEITGGSGSAIDASAYGAAVRLVGNASSNRLVSGAFNDTLDGGAGSDTADLSRATGNITLTLDAAGNATTGVVAGIGNDSLIRIERIIAGSGADRLVGNASDNSLSGNGGNDTLSAGLGADTLLGGAGDDVILVQVADHIFDDSIDGGANTDRIRFISTTAGETLFLGSGQASIEIAELTNVSGSGDGTTQLNIDAVDLATSIQLRGNAGANLLMGGSGDDTLFGGLGNDTLQGNGGTDIADWSSATAAITLALNASGSGTLGPIAGVGTDTYSSIEGAFTGSGDDRLTGNNAANVFNGGGGNDTIDGGLGNDTLDGGGGLNTLDYSARSAGIVATILGFGYGEGEATIGSETDSFVNFSTIIGGSGDDSFATTDGANLLVGGGGADTLDGGFDGDTMNGGTGDDFYFVDNVNDVVIDASGQDTIFAEVLTFLPDGSVDRTFTLQAGLEIEVVQLGGFSGASAIGNELGQTIIGNAFGNSLEGRGGADSLQGMLGDDSLFGGLGNDTIDGGQENDTIDGGDGADSILGGDGADSVDGDTQGEGVHGDDTIFGGDGDDFLAGVGGDDLIRGGDGEDFIDGDIGNDTLFGDNGDDQFDGIDGEDVIDGGTGADTVQGGRGDDKIFVDEAGDVVIEFAGEGSDTIVASGNYTLDGGSGGGDVSEIEFLTAGAANVNLTGNAFGQTLIGGTGSNVLSGVGGADTLNGGLGADTLNGGQGSDTADWSGATGAIVFTLTEAGGGVTSNVAGIGVDTLISIENLIGGSAADSLTGNTGANVLRGGRGNDTLNGGQGSDTADWSTATGAVVFTLTEAGGGVTANVAGINVDTLIAIENLIGGSAADSLTGNGQANLLRGGIGKDTLNGGIGADTLDGGVDNDTLNGGAGVDSLIGGTGDDRYFVDNAADVVVEIGATSGGSDSVFANVNYTLAGGVGVETLGTFSSAGTDAINLMGNEFAQAINGNAGANTLNGRGGADTMQGYAGDDRYFVDSASDVVIETGAASGGKDTVFANVNYTLAGGVGVETLATFSPSGTDAINLMGNEFAQALNGNAAANSLNGRGGADTMQGYGGDDRYFVDSASDVVIETGAASGGSDSVFANVNYTLAGGVGVETLGTFSTTGADAINLMGNEFAQALNGNVGANSLNGRGGADTMQGFGGDDRYFVDSASDVVIEGASGGSDTVFAAVSYTLAAGVGVETLGTFAVAGTGAIDLTGNELANAVLGNDGANSLNGGRGNDTLTGFNGQDSFVFSTTLGAGNVDRITDFKASDDTVRLSKSAFAGLGVGTLGVDAFKQITSTSGVIDGDDRIIYNKTTGALFFDADGSGTSSPAIQFATLDNKAAITNADFVIF